MALRELTLHVKAQTLFDPETGRGGVHFTFSPAIVRDPDTHEELGRISGCLGGGVEIAVGDGLENLWFISPSDLWIALQTALSEQEDHP